MPKLKILRSQAAALEMDRRGGRRIAQELLAEAEVVLSPEGPDLVGQVAVFVTRDVPTSGLLVRSNLDLPVGCLLNLRLNLPGRQEPLQLQALVKWNSEDTACGQFMLGIELRERPPEGYRVWRDRVLKQIRFLDF